MHHSLPRCHFHFKGNQISHNSSFLEPLEFMFVKKEDGVILLVTPDNCWFSGWLQKYINYSEDAESPMKLTQRSHEEQQGNKYQKGIIPFELSLWFHVYWQKCNGKSKAILFSFVLIPWRNFFFCHHIKRWQKFKRKYKLLQKYW